MDKSGSEGDGLFDGVFEDIPQDEIDEIQEAIKTGGVARFSEYVIKNQNKWKETPLNVGFIGNSGVGKSSTINSVLGLKASSQGAAEVGTEQTTMEPTAFEHPINPSLKLWDLPGVGTPEFPKEVYFEKIGFEKFDFFLILATMRFREEDVWLGKEIMKREKEFFYVRTMIDNDIQNNEHDKGYSKEQTIKEVRENIEKNVAKQGLKHTGIYLISNRHLADYDFPRLMTDLVSSFPRLKRNALALTLRAHTEEMIEQKVQVLQGRIKWAAMLSAAASAVPIPGVGIAADVAIVVHEIRFYHEQLGLSEGAIKELGLATGVEPAQLIKTASNIFPTTLLTTAAITAALTEAPVLAAETAIEEMAKYIPLIGSVISGALSFAVILWFLNETLSKMHEAAKVVMKEALTKHVVC